MLVHSSYTVSLGMAMSLSYTFLMVSGVKETRGSITALESVVVMCYFLVDLNPGLPDHVSVYLFSGLLQLLC